MFVCDSTRIGVDDVVVVVAVVVAVDALLIVHDFVMEVALTMTR